MILTHVIFLVSFGGICGLQSKLFDKALIEPSSILPNEVQHIQKSSIDVDKITCATFCLGASDDCDAFYFKDTTCSIIKNATGLIKTKTSNTEALTIFSSKVTKESIGSLYRYNILIHIDLWTHLIYKSEPSTQYEKCGILCELTDQADFFAFHFGTCYCGSFSHSGSTLDFDQSEISLHMKSEPADKLLDDTWMMIEEMDQWKNWIYKVHQREEQNYGHRDCLFKGMYHKECDFIKFDYGTKQCFLGSFYYTGQPMTIDTNDMDGTVYFKQNSCLGEDWTLVGKTCYKVPDEMVDFAKAKEICSDMGAKLVEPKSLEQNEKIAELVKQKFGPDDRYFIGLSDRLEQSKFVYESTGQELIFDNWHPGQPNHLDEQDCGKVHLEDNNLWFDDQCTLDNHFVCEKELQKWDYAKIDFKPSKDHVATIFPVFGPEFKIEMRLTFLQFPSNDKCVFSIVSNAGTTIVALWAWRYKTLKFFHGIGTEPIKEHTVQKQKPQDILISQFLKNNGKWMFEIHVKNQVIFSVQNENPDTFINTKLYLSEKTLPSANVEIDYFFVDHGQGFVHPGFEKYDFSPTQNHLATTFAKYGPEFKYQMVLTVNEFPDLQGGTFHLTTGSSTSGNRYPALVIRSQNEFRFQCEITGILNTQDYPDIESETKYEIVIEQFAKDGKVTYEINVNEIIVIEMENTIAMTLNNAKLYLTSPWWPSADVTLDYFIMSQGLDNKSPDFEKFNFNPTKDTIAAGFPTYGPIFKFHMKLKVNLLPTLGLVNIFRLTSNDFDQLASRYPALWLHKDGYFEFHNEMDSITYPDIVLDQFYEITIQQSFKNGQLIYEVLIDQNQLASLEKSQANMLTNARLHLSDKWYETADVTFEFFKLYLGQDSKQDQFIKNNYISMVGDTTKPNGFLSSQFWPTSLYKSLNTKEPELTCAEMCSLVANCMFYYFVDLMPSQDNICHFGDFRHADYTKQYDEITEDTEYKLNANIDLESFGAGSNPDCPGSGHTRLDTMLTLEYTGTTGALCYYSIYAPDSKELKIKIEQLTIHDGDFMNLAVAPTFGGHRYARLSPTSSSGEHRVKSRFLKVFWKNVDTNVEAKWKMTITPLYQTNF